MEEMTYALLLQDIQTYAERSDAPFVAQMPRFVMLAENRISSEVRGLGFLRFVMGNVLQATPIVQKPVRWRETASMQLIVGGTRVPLFQRSLSYCRALSPNGAVTAQPQYYADYDYENFLVAPAPDQDYAFELAYHEKPTPLSEANQTNWTTRYAPQLLLYAALLEAQPFLKLGSRTQEFQQLYMQAVASLTAETDRRLAGDQSNVRTIG